MIKRYLFVFFALLVSCFQPIVPSSVQSMGWEEGSPQKIALHAAVGAAVAAVADGDVLSVASALSAKGIIDIVNLAKQGKFKPDGSGGDTKPKTDGDTNTPNNTIDNVVDDTPTTVDEVIADGDDILPKVRDDVGATNRLPDVVSEGGKTWTKTTVGGRSVYKNNSAFDPNYVDPNTGLTNIQRMKKERPPLGTGDKPVESHHMTQNEVNGFNGSRGAVAEVTNDFHNNNYNTIHIYKKGNPEYVSWRKNKPQAEKEFNNFRRSYWKERAGDF